MEQIKNKKNNSEEIVPVVEINVIVSDDSFDYEKIQIISTVDCLMNKIKRCSEITETEKYFVSSNFYEFLSNLNRDYNYETNISDPLMNYLCCLEEIKKIIKEGQNGGYTIYVRLHKFFEDDYSAVIMSSGLMKFFKYDLPKWDRTEESGYKMTFGGRLQLIEESEQNLLISIAKIINGNSENNQISLKLLKEKLKSLGYKLDWNERLVNNSNLEFYSIDENTDTFELNDWFWVKEYLFRNSTVLNISA